MYLIHFINFLSLVSIKGTFAGLKMLDRRKFTFGGIIALASGVIAFDSEASHKKVINLRSLLHQKEFKQIIPYKALRNQSIGNSFSAEQLIEKIFQKNLPKSTNEVYEFIQISAKEDFKFGRTVQIDGWIFSKTVVDFSLLQYFVFGE